ncbi:MAG TPA: hypothetical protein VHH13_13485 [Arthrobacter sp.]|nr:hypothetical protein [Arthrobacter sp.]
MTGDPEWLPAQRRLDRSSGDLGGFRVTGGIGGAAFQWEELEDAAVRLESVAADADRIHFDIYALQLTILDSRLFMVPGRLSAQEAVRRALEAVQAAAEAIREIADQVNRAKEVYGQAEAAANGALNALHQGTWWLSTPSGALGNELRPTLTGTERLLNHGTRGLLALPPAPGVPDDPQNAGSGPASTTERLVPHLVETANGLGLLQPAPISVTRLGDTGSGTGGIPVAGPVRLEATHAGLLARAGAAAAAGPGTIEILETEAAGGKSWVVSLPGTQSRGPAATANPFDETGVAEALAYDSRHVSAAVSAALEEAGAEAADQVVLVGYSQGGIHAMNMAADKAFLAEHNVAYVLTAGSPVGGVDLPEGLRSLHLEHAQDWVPGADGRSSPDTRDRVTVTLTNEVATPEGEDGGLGPGHDFGNYVAGAQLLQDSTDVSVADAGLALGTAVGGGLTSRHLFTLTRQVPVREPLSPQKRASYSLRNRPHGY